MEGLSGLSFTGICLPSRNLTHELLVRFLVRLWQLGIPWVHILGTVSFSNMGIAAYFARQELFQLVSMDSRGWMTSGSKNKFLSPANLLACYINEKTWIPESLRNDCPCPFCRNVSFQDMSFDIYHSRSALLCGHNAWVTELVAGELFKNARTFDQLNHFMMQRKSHNERNTPKAMKALAAAIKKFGIWYNLFIVFSFWHSSKGQLSSVLYYLNVFKFFLWIFPSLDFWSDLLISVLMNLRL